MRSPLSRLYAAPRIRGGRFRKRFLVANVIVVGRA
jgi:hypothetical protein